jgi:hypothetical protein
MVFLAIGITILKHSAYQNQVNQELLMAAMLLMNEDTMVNIFRPHKHDFCKDWF